MVKKSLYPPLNLLSETLSRSSLETEFLQISELLKPDNSRLTTLPSLENQSPRPELQNSPTKIHWKPRILLSSPPTLLKELLLESLSISEIKLSWVELLVLPPVWLLMRLPLPRKLPISSTSSPVSPSSSESRSSSSPSSSATTGWMPSSS